MKLQKIHLYEVVVPAREQRVNSPEYGPTIWDQSSKFILEGHTDHGLIGLGETKRSTSKEALLKALERLRGIDLTTVCLQEPPLSSGMDGLFGPAPSDRPHRYEERSFNSIGHLALHVLMLDLLGKDANLPACALLGGAYRDHVHVNAWIGRMTPEDAAHAAREAMEQGYSGIKCKAALEDDIVERAEAIREACGEKFELSVDPNFRFYRPSEALPTLRRLAALGNVVCVEDPFPATNPEWYRLVRQEGLMPLALTVGYDGTLIEMIRSHACDYANIKGVPWDIRKAGDVCWAAGIPTWLGTGIELGVLEAAYLHIAAATKSATGPSEIFGRFIREHNLISDPLAPRDGYVPLPQGPGLGVALDRDALDRFMVSEEIIELAR